MKSELGATKAIQGEDRQRLRELSQQLLDVHKALMDHERIAYERINGRVTPGELLQLLLGNEQFAWLRNISQFVVQIDQALDCVEPAADADPATLFALARKLLVPDENGDDFSRKYQEALQNSPDAFIAHVKVTRLIGIAEEHLS